MKKIVTIAAALVLALVIPACGQGQARGAPDGELNIAWNAQPPTLDPLMATSNATRDLSRNIFEPLVTVDGKGKVRPVLASSFKMNDTDDEITFKLRHGVIFHNGKPMTDEDVIASIKRWIKLSASGQTYFSGAEVSAPKRGVVTMKFGKPVPMAPTLLGDQNMSLVVMPEGVIPNDPGKATTDLIGTGPYLLKKWDTDHYVKFDKFDDYVSPPGDTDGAAGQKSPYYRSIYYHFVPDSNTRVAGLQTGEYDIAFEMQQDTAQAIKNDDDIVQDVTASNYQVAIYNKKSGPMSDLKMRQAASSAVNLKPILQGAFAFPRFYSDSRSLMPKDSNLYSGIGLEKSLGHSKNRAEKLLQQAGYHGEPVRLITSRDYEQLYKMTIVFQQQLKDVGINAKMVVADFPTVSSRLNSPAEWDIFIDSPSWRVLPNSHTHLNAKNFGWPSDPRLKRALHSVIQSRSGKDARKAVGQVQSAYFDYQVAARLGDSSSIIGFRKGLRGLESSATSGPIFYNVHPDY